MPPIVEDETINSGRVLYDHYYEYDDNHHHHHSTNNNSPNNSSHNSQSSKLSRAPPLPYLAPLQNLPALREIPWRAGQELPPDKSTDSKRVQTRGACLLATRGNIAIKPCDHCAAGFGRFTACITLGQWFQGACSTCIFTSKGSKCSLRTKTLGKPNGRTLRYLPSTKAEKVAVWEEPTSKKRKRRSLAAQTPTTPQTPGHTQTLPSNHHQSSRASASPLPASLDMDSIIQGEIARDEPHGLLGYVRQMEKRQKRHHTIPREDSHDLLPPRNGILRYGLPEETHRRSSGAMTYLPRPQGAGPRPVQKVWPVQTIPKENASSGVTAPSDWSRGGKDKVIPLIDTLPKAKQRQIFGLISGLQGGIDHLQKQVNLLQQSLGIGLE